MASVLAAHVENKHIDAAVQMFLSIEKKYPDFSVDHFKVIDLCTLLIENGRTEGENCKVL